MAWEGPHFPPQLTCRSASAGSAAKAGLVVPKNRRLTQIAAKPQHVKTPSRRAQAGRKNSMSTVKLPNRTAAIAALRSAIQIHSCNGCGGPGKWTVDGRGRNFIALTVTWDDFPESVVADEPWELWGGEEILACAHLESERMVSGDESGSFFASAIIFVAD